MTAQTTSETIYIGSDIYLKPGNGKVTVTHHAIDFFTRRGSARRIAITACNRRDTRNSLAYSEFIEMVTCEQCLDREY